MNDTHLSEARLAVRRATGQLAEDARALTAACAEALEVGLAKRAVDLRRAVIAAWHAGASPDELAQDARVKVSLIEEWITTNARHCHVR